MDDFELELKRGFLEEAAQLLADSEQCFLALEKAHSDPTIVEKIFRLAHNLKGSAGAVGFVQVGEFTHRFESLILKLKKGELAIGTRVIDLTLRCNDHLRMMIDRLRDDIGANFDQGALLAELDECMNGTWVEESAPSAELLDVASKWDTPAEPAAMTAQPEPTSGLVPAPVSVPAPAQAPSSSGSTSRAAAADETLRVSLSKLDLLLNYVGEMVILQTVLDQQRVEVQSPLIQTTIVQLSKISKNIQEISMSLRMVPLKTTFQKMHRIVRDTSKALGKEVQLILEGEDTELDKTVLEYVSDPLVHLIRNAVDHGLESTEKRRELGKPEVGTVHLRAFHKGGMLIIEVQDDGKGLDAQRLREKAREKGLVPAGRTLSDNEAYELIFSSGFSTKTEVSDISGRGVGLDVVKTNIQQIEGDVQLETKLGQGTCFRIVLPLTLAIIDGMLLRSDEHRYVIPLSHLHESLRPQAKDVHKVSGMGEILSLRGESMPLYRLSAIMGHKATSRPAEDGIAMVIRTGAEPFAVLVDDIVGQQQVVVKRLGAEVPQFSGVSGSAVLGDGRVALILDLGELIKGLSRGAKGRRVA